MWNHLKDFIFPNFCLECGREGEWWCPTCRSGFSFAPKCSQPEKSGRDINYLDGVLAFFNYEEDSSAARLLKQFKYQYAFDIEEVWKQIIIAEARFLGTYADFDLIPIPLYPKRERQRGFNQAQVLANIICSLPDWRGVIRKNLKRIRHTECQAGLSREKRLINLKNAFIWEGDGAPGRVLLIDDVYTTGSTMNECAKAIKNAGSQSVFGLVLAKG